MYNTNLPLRIARTYWDLPRTEREKIAIRTQPMSITLPRVMRFVSKHVLLPAPLGPGILRPNENEAGNVDSFSR